MRSDYREEEFSLLTLFIRALMLYIALVAFTRAMGKRQMGQLQPYEFVMTRLIANLVASPMSNVATPLLHGLLPVAALFIAHSAITLMSLRSDRMRSFFSGKPSLIISKGVWQQQEMKKLCLTIADVLEGLRTSGILDPAEVETAIVEANGAINAFPYASKRPPTADEMNVDPGYEGLPMTLIMDGRIQTGNLGTAQLDQTQLEQMLSSRRLAAESVFFCSLDTQGRMMIQDRAGNVTQFQAIDPGEVKW